MQKNNFVRIEIVEDQGSYIIKDNNKVIGKMDILEYSMYNKNCTFRFYFNKDENRYEYIIATIDKFTTILFDTANLYKVNILVNEGIEIQPFLDLNFHIEGILMNNRIIDSKFSNEILLGIDYDEYRKYKKVSRLRIDGENIYLELLTTDDAEKLLNYYIKNKEYLRNFEELRDESFYTLETQKIFITQQYSQMLNGRAIFFGIFKAEHLIGIIQLYNIIGGIFKDGTMGYSIDEGEQGKGYMKEAVNLILEYAFNSLKLHRVQASTLVYNLKSINVLKSCGFKEIGISEKYLLINGDWSDQYLFYKLNRQM